MKLTKVLLVAGGLVAGAVAGNAFTTLAEPAELDSQSTFVEMTPCRLVDTRAKSVDNTAVVQDEGALEKETKRTYTAAGKCGVPSNATSLSVNLAAITPTSNTFMTMWDTGSDRPNSSSINPEAALSVTGNTTIVALSDSGKFDIYNNAGQVDYVIDVLGYYVDGFGTSAIPNLTDTGDGFSLIFDFSQFNEIEDTATGELNDWTSDLLVREFFGVVVNLENEARWAYIETSSSCPSFTAEADNGDGSTSVVGGDPVPAGGMVPAIRPYEGSLFWVEAGGTTGIQWTGLCQIPGNATVDGGGTVMEAVNAQTFVTKEVTPELIGQ
jgi:hypothetical protein